MGAHLRHRCVQGPQDVPPSDLCATQARASSDPALFAPDPFGHLFGPSQCPAIISDYLETSKYDNEALQDDDGHHYCVGTTLLQAIERHCVPTDDETSMTVLKQFETLLNGFPGIISVSSFRQLEKWANKTAE